MKLAAHGAQTLGQRVRQEDGFALVQLPGEALLAVVADGLGGHPAGDLASRIAIEGIADFARRDFARLHQAPPAALQDVAQAIDDALVDISSRHPPLAGMATTLSALYFTPERVFRLSIGDSLIHRLHGRSCARWNELHEGEDGFLTSCLGGNLRHIDCPPRGAAVKAGDRFLIASDGIEVLDAKAVCRLLRAGETPQQCVQSVLDAIDAVGFEHQDNSTVIAVFA
ncbi:MAG TPA: protein phosphatase 2C domain-containing protein [Candidatus Binatia bacterium]|nr:protein phosphatase 2C domain-containing protein [Candidatus Binatia bacterium]